MERTSRLLEINDFRKSRVSQNIKVKHFFSFFCKKESYKPQINIKEF